ncbi:histone deacetylation protein Rxt3-domain-containing protein [Sporodiniella umbellata]|nr:histone deacetylation protein Rxt3-domain-containing protein [Sporodiniella umbellata]
MKSNSCLKESPKAVTPSPRVETEDTLITSEELLIALTSVPLETKSVPANRDSLNEIKALPEDPPSQPPLGEAPPSVSEPKLLTAPLNESDLVTPSLQRSFAVTGLPPPIPVEAVPVEAPPQPGLVSPAVFLPSTVQATALPEAIKPGAESVLPATDGPPKETPPPKPEEDQATSTKERATPSEAQKDVKEETIPLVKVESSWTGEPKPVEKTVSPKVVPLAAPSTGLTLNSLPDISAALRRLSHSGVMEQLTGETKRASIDASPSEILGNALAAVAASARANSNLPHPEDTTATAIGNLAAITANISNLLTSSGFSRGSFSQEDTQKLAAVVAGATPNSPNPRRNSSITAVGNAFSSMIDQAIQIRRHHTQLAAAPRPKLIVKNDQVWKAIEGIEEKRLGYHLYVPQRLLPTLEHAVNGLIEVRIPAKYLSFENAQVKKKAVWGTDIYTDDSDIVAMIIHSGKYQPEFKEPNIEPNDPFALAIAGKSKEAMEASKKLVLSGKRWISPSAIPLPDHDLKVTLRVLPRLQLYSGSIRHCLKSRDWGKHDGVSLFVHKIEKIKRGEARLSGRSSLKATMFTHEHHRKLALGLNKQEKPKETRIQKGRIKKTPKAMRAFQLYSKSN